MFEPFVVIAVILAICLFVAWLIFIIEEGNVPAIVATVVWVIGTLLLWGQVIGPMPEEEIKPPVCQCPEVTVCRD